MSSKPLLVASAVHLEYPQRDSAGMFMLDVALLEVHRYSTLAIAGGSGEGKSTLLGVLCGHNRPKQGTVRFHRDGETFDVYSGFRREFKAFRRQVGFVHQDPRGSLNPRRTLVDIVSDPLAIHGLGTRRGRAEEAARMLDHVGIPASRHHDTPLRLSGGQRQRVAIARALVMRPALVFLDEPTSALDVSVQAAVVELLTQLRTEFGLTYVVVSHDLALLRQFADRIIWMQSGRVIGDAPVDTLFASGQ